MLYLKTPRMKEVEAQFGKPLKELIPELYERHQNSKAVAHALGITRITLQFWCLQLGIEVRRVATVAGAAGR